MFEYYSKFIDGIEKVLAVCIVILLTAGFIVIFGQVILRYFFATGQTWMEESAKYIIIWLTFLGSPIAIRHRKHLYIDIFELKFSPKIQLYLNVFFDVLVLIFFVIMLKYGWKYCFDNISNFSPGLLISMSYVYFSLIVGFVLMILFTIECLWSRLLTGQAHPQTFND